MPSMDEPFQPPDLTDLLEMERIIGTFDDTTTAAEVEEEIIRYVDRICDEAAQLIRANRLAVGDSAVVLPTRKWLQTSLRPLFEAGERLPPDQRLRYLIHLWRTIMAAYNLGGFPRLTKTARAAAAAETGRRVGQKKLQKAQPLIEGRRAAVQEINATLPSNLGWKARAAKINENLQARGTRRVNLRTLQRDLAVKPNTSDA
jgi:hypothetical protein